MGLHPKSKTKGGLALEFWRALLLGSHAQIPKVISAIGGWKPIQWPASDSWWVEHWAAPWLKFGTMHCLSLLTNSRMKCSWSCFDGGFRLQLVGKSNTGPKLLINLGFSVFCIQPHNQNHQPLSMVFSWTSLLWYLKLMIQKEVIHPLKNALWFLGCEINTKPWMQGCTTTRLLSLVSCIYGPMFRWKILCWWRMEDVRPVELVNPPCCLVSNCFFCLI